MNVGINKHVSMWEKAGYKIYVIKVNLYIMNKQLEAREGTH